MKKCFLRKIINEDIYMKEKVKKMIWLYIIVIIQFISPLFSDPVPGVPDPGETILMIYCTGDGGNNQDLVNNIKSALNAMPIPPVLIDEVIIPDGDRNGFYDNLGGRDLKNYCQVWDLRFRGDHINQGSGMVMEDTITGAPFMPGPTSDAALFIDFLSNGGHLYIQGENQGFFGRNESVIQFLSDITGSTIGYPNFYNGPIDVNNYLTNAPENLSSDFNILNSSVVLNTDYPGAIPLTQVGKGRPLTTLIVNSVNSAMDLAFLPTDLNTGNGKIFANFETNCFLTGRFDLNNEGKYIQNIYDYLAACYKYTITKSVSPGHICIGETATFTICYNNTGKDLPNVTLWDTIPNCLSVISTSQPPSGVNGKLYWWNFGSIPSGTNVCINIIVRAENLNCE